jgi:hypothetical protein
MQQTRENFANRCLPLRMANQLGWFILNDVDVTAVWNGADSPAALRIQTPTGSKSNHIKSHFGYGILTWTIPYLFRTPAGVNLYVRGPANAPKDGACALDGVVETDWAVATFTMNWKLTCVNVPVSFKAGEPIAMIMPMRRGEIETFGITVRDLTTDGNLQREYHAWSESRRDFLDAFNSGKQDRMGWQKDYFFGTSAHGEKFQGHQVQLKIGPVVDETGWDTSTSPERLPGDVGARDREQRVIRQALRLLLRRARRALRVRR